MSPRLILASTLVLTTAASAQVSTPKGFLDKEGNSTATFSLGDYKNGRFMYLDGTHRGSAMTVKGTDYRLANYIYTSSNGQGRSFTNVKVFMSNGDLKTFSSTFTKNQTSAPTKVFDAAVSWPTQTGKPALSPAPWAMTFPFSTSWAYSGTTDMCLDYQFNGGTLANNASWGTTTNRPRYKDAQTYPTNVIAYSSRLGKSGNYVGCNDRGVNHIRGARIDSNVRVYSPDYPTANLRNVITFQQTGRDFGPNRPALTIIGVKSIKNGFRFPGVTCNNVYIDFTLPTFNIPGFTSATGSLVTLNLSAKNPGLKDIELVSQTAWGDSTNAGILNFSDAATLFVPETPKAQPTNLCYYYNSTNKTGFVSNSRSYQPVRRIVK